MRTHLLQVARRVLVPLLLTACQEASTDPQGDAKADHSTPPMSPAISASPSGKKLVYRAIAKGGYATVEWCCEPDAVGNVIYGRLEVMETGTSNAEAFLNYEVWRSDAEGNGTEVEAGEGPIPRADLKVSGISQLRLSTNTNTNPNFQLFAGAGGLVSIEWNSDNGGRFPVSQYRFSGHTEVQSGNWTERSTGTFSQYFAGVTGTVVGFPIPETPWSFLGSNHYKVVTIFR